MARLILASASPRRLALLAQIGITPQVVEGADLDETHRPSEHALPYALRLAAAKAQAVATRYPGDVILGADTVVAVGSRILPKAESDAEARTCLTLLSGRRHRVTTAIAVVAPGGFFRTAHSVSIVTFKRLGDDEIKAYLASGEWRGKAGGYAIQGYAAALVRAFSGSWTGVVGLPLYETRQLLRVVGIAC